MRLLLALSLAVPSAAQVGPSGAALFLDFEGADPGVRLFHGVQATDGRFGHALEFTHALQYAEVELSRKLDGIAAMSVGGWFFPRRSGEQVFFSRGTIEIAPRGERMFPRSQDWTNFVLGTDHHGFWLGTIHGNGTMPFPYVTLNEAVINRWHQLVVVKDAQGHHSFYQNGTLVHTDRDSAWSGHAWPFRDVTAGEPVRLTMPLGGLIGEAWIFPRELTAAEIGKDFLTRRDRYNPAPPGEVVLLREMNAHPAAGL